MAEDRQRRELTLPSRTGYKTDNRGVNGASMSSGLWIERGRWATGGGAQDPGEKDGVGEPPEKLLNLHGTPSDYAEVDATSVPLMSNNFHQPQQLQTTLAPGKPVAYATTNIIRSRDVSSLVVVPTCVESFLLLRTYNFE